jgi:hypothetical protein
LKAQLEIMPPPVTNYLPFITVSQPLVTPNQSSIHIVSFLKKKDSMTNQMERRKRYLTADYMKILFGLLVLLIPFTGKGTVTGCINLVNPTSLNAEPFTLFIGNGQLSNLPGSVNGSGTLVYLPHIYLPESCAALCFTDCNGPGSSDGVPADYFGAEDLVTLTGPGGFFMNQDNISDNSYCIVFPSVGTYTLTFYYDDGTVYFTTEIHVTEDEDILSLSNLINGKFYCNKAAFLADLDLMMQTYQDVVDAGGFSQGQILIDGQPYNVFDYLIFDFKECEGSHTIEFIDFVDQCGNAYNDFATFHMLGTDFITEIKDCRTVCILPTYCCYDSGPVTWDFDSDGNIDHMGQFPDCFQYAEDGTYTIQMFVSGGLTASHTVTVGPAFTPVLTGPINTETPCNESTLIYTFTNHADMVSPYLTYYGGGTAAIDPSTSGTIIVTVLDNSQAISFTLHYTDKFGCESSVTVIIPECCDEHLPIHGDAVVCTGTTTNYSFSNLLGPMVLNPILVLPSGIGFVTPGSSSNNFNVTWTGAGTAVIVVGYSYGHGCFGKSSITVEVVKGVNANFAPVLPLCSAYGPVDLAEYTHPSGGTFSGPGVTDNSFDPAAVGVGNWTVTYTVTDPMGVCPPSIATQTIVVHDGRWNISTETPVKHDEGDDIITDDEGNVYVTGTFQLQTTFPGSVNVTVPAVALSSSAPEYGAAYIVKYDACGELLWVNFDDHDAVVSSNFGVTHGSAITIDNAHNDVYIGGLIEQDVRFQGVAATPFAAAVPGITFDGPANGSYYIARFDTETGAFENIHIFPPFGVTTTETDYELTGLDIVVGPSHVLNADVYYSGYYSSGAGSQTFSMVGRIHSNSAGFSMAGEWRKKNNTGDISHAWDVAVNGALNRVYITGDFNGGMTFSPLSPISTTAASDGYFATFNSNSGMPLDFRKCGAMPGETSKGTGVDLDASGKIYLTGTVSYDVPSLFGISGASFVSGTSLEQRGYILKINPSYSYLWHRRIQAAAGGDVEPTDIFVSATNVYVTGTFTEEILFPPFGSPATDFTSATPGLRKAFVYELGTLLGGPHWFNATKDATTGSEHLTARITASDTYTYSTGTYIGEMDYNVTSTVSVPFSGPLNSSLAGSYNTYIVRNAVTNGDFKSAETGDALVMDETIQHEEFEVYPNPTNGELKIVLEGEVNNKTVEIMITDISGKVVFSEARVLSEDPFVDCSNFESGMYFIQISDGIQEYYGKVVKE